ncbi:MAG TPA: tetratricopeptide repeat protein [Verrucomicrobiae bacterium]|nr:tetratricopeptide repeat protein [Verrucomicrobiae bacterium]
MKPSPEPDAAEQSWRLSPRLWIVVLIFLLVIVLSILLPGRHKQPSAGDSADKAASGAASGHASSSFSVTRRPHGFGADRSPAATPEEIVAAKVKQFGRIRRETARGLARHLGKEVPAEVEQFFDAMDSGDWEEIQMRFRGIAKRAGRYDYSTEHAPELDSFWRPVQEAFGAAEQAHAWPAQQLLDYGNAVLGSLRPGMVFVGGTDSGCFIPTMMNETSDGERHVVLTQNGLTDATYLDYLKYLYGDQMAMPTHEDLQRAFQTYTEDAQKRYLHDQEHPDEPKQLRPGEDISFGPDGKANVRGQAAVMSINELILKTMLQNNPNLSFAMEESFSLPSTYVGAAPLGPIFELRAQDGDKGMSADAVAQSLDYWRAEAQQLIADPASATSKDTMKSWSHDLAAQAHLFAANKFPDQAEQAYRLAGEMAPDSPEVTFGYVDLLVQQKRLGEAAQVAQAALKSAPDNKMLKDLAQRILQMK